MPPGQRGTASAAKAASVRPVRRARAQPATVSAQRECKCECLMLDCAVLWECSPSRFVGDASSPPPLSVVFATGASWGD
eukprot:1227216-Prymnesium_polylepis.1